MDGLGTSSPDLTAVAIMTVASWLGAMMLSGLIAAHYKLSGLYRNGLVAEDSLGPVLRGYLNDERRFQVTTGTLYLAATVLGVWGWGNLLHSFWPVPLALKFHVVYCFTAVLLWSAGGLVFKIVASDMALSYSRFVGFMIFPFTWLLRPWVALLLTVMNRRDDTLWTTEAQAHLSVGEIRNLLNTDGPDDTLDEEDREMIQSIFSFHDTAVREIMIPRIDMVSLDGDLEVVEALHRVIDHGHSRIPVFEGNIDKVTGILYAKDLLKLHRDGGLIGEGVKLADLARDAYFIPESKKIDEVLDEFRAKRMHMAVVIDEYGGTAGLVTLEDVIEEIVGEIEDEFDEEEQLLKWIDARTVRLDPKIDLEDLSETLGVTFAEAEGADTSETLGGLIYEAAGNVPSEGDEVEVAGFRITVEEVADQRLTMVLMHYHQDLPGHSRQGEAGGE